jgi:hypothetical protein
LQEIIIDSPLSLSVRDKNKSPIMCIIASVCSLKCLFWVWDCGVRVERGLDGMLLPTTKVIIVFGDGACRVDQTTTIQHLLFYFSHPPTID